MFLKTYPFGENGDGDCSIFDGVWIREESSLWKCFVVVIVSFIVGSVFTGSELLVGLSAFQSLVSKVLFFLLMEENGVASDERGGDEDFACVALEGGILYSGLGVEHLAT